MKVRRFQDDDKDEVFALPITLPTVHWLKRTEQEDFFDTSTDLYPFVIAVKSRCKNRGVPNSRAEASASRTP
jgi:hypothetical protein